MSFLILLDSEKLRILKVTANSWPGPGVQSNMPRALAGVLAVTSTQPLLQKNLVQAATAIPELPKPWRITLGLIFTAHSIHSLSSNICEVPKECTKYIRPVFFGEKTVR